MELFPNKKILVPRNVLEIYHPDDSLMIAVLKYNRYGPYMMLPETLPNLAVDLKEQGTRGLVVDYTRVQEMHIITREYLLFNENFMACRLVGINAGKAPKSAQISSSVDEAVKSVLDELLEKRYI